jgi:hypothetical protein
VCVMEKRAAPWHFIFELGFLVIFHDVDESINFPDCRDISIVFSQLKLIITKLIRNTRKSCNNNRTRAYLIRDCFPSCLKPYATEIPAIKSLA